MYASQLLSPLYACLVLGLEVMAFTNCCPSFLYALWMNALKACRCCLGLLCMK
jgi:hypothetical protein